MRDPNHCVRVLTTLSGPVILRHHALCFGSTASVWGFNRPADAMTFLARRPLAVTLCHYVDDFVAIEPFHLVQSGFELFSRLTRILGLRMKEPKALPPQKTQKVLGVRLEINEREVILRPHPNRCQKVASTEGQTAPHRQKVRAVS